MVTGGMTRVRSSRLTTSTAPWTFCGDRPGWDITREGPSYHLTASVAFRDVDPADYSALFLTGGRAPEYIRYDPDLMRIVQHFFTEKKPVAVVCHGAEIVAAADVIRGRRLATVAKCRMDVTLCGGIYVNEGCVRDGNMVSGRTWHELRHQPPAGQP